jgi:hypothetical protein
MLQIRTFASRPELAGKRTRRTGGVWVLMTEQRLGCGASIERYPKRTEHFGFFHPK